MQDAKTVGGCVSDEFSEAHTSVHLKARPIAGSLIENNSAFVKTLSENKNPLNSIRLVNGFLGTLLTGDALDRQVPVYYDPRQNKPAVLTINGVGNTNDSARHLNLTVKGYFSVDKAGWVTNDTHWGYIGDFVQVLFNEYLGAVDATSIRAAAAIRQGISEKGEIFVVAHSQGSAVFEGALHLLRPKERAKIHYLGVGMQVKIDKEKWGLASASNIVNQGDIVPGLGNRFRVSKWLDPSAWGRRLDIDRWPISITINKIDRHSFETNYSEAVKDWVTELKRDGEVK